ncbi:MAG TPA: hypothetical protein VFA32_11670, partial [Dehalococcoidia bacterium]|nr:hypothetical protein [Dehalococcoidia bacterium]
LSQLGRVSHWFLALMVVNTQASPSTRSAIGFRDATKNRSVQFSWFNGTSTAEEGPVTLILWKGDSINTSHVHGIGIKASET